MIPQTPPVPRGRRVRLEPLTREHIPDLVSIGLDPDLWRWTVTSIRTAEDMAAYVRTALEEQQAGCSLPFVIVELGGGAVVGCTRFGSIERKHRRVEIGWTWIARRWQRTFVNTETKYLMLRYAFDEMQCVRVELKTDRLNERSRNAILRIGAVEEGILRSHFITASGRLRDTVYFSILASEWPDVRRRLEAKLDDLVAADGAS